MTEILKNQEIMEKMETIMEKFTQRIIALENDKNRTSLKQQIQRLKDKY